MSTQKQYFGTDGIRGVVGDDVINPEFVLKLGWAVGKTIANDNKGKVLIGKDTRLSGYMLETALQAGLSAAGLDIRLLGPMPTPAVAYLTRTFDADMGIVISASHNSYIDNGIKFFGPDGRKISDKWELAIEQQLSADFSVVGCKDIGKVKRVNDAQGRFIEFCKSTVPPSIRLDDFKIVVDCAHGATYHIAPYVFEELGATIIAIGNQPDGFNINAQCGSTHPKRLQAMVIEQEADLGIAFDGDGDRVIMVDHMGQVVDGDELLYIIAKHRVDDDRSLAGVVGTSMSNLGLEQSLHKLGIEFIRAQVGDRYVMETLDQRGWVLGGESSGHIICLDKISTGDGIVAALQVLMVVVREGKSLADLRRSMIKYPQVLLNITSSHAKQVINDEYVVQAVAELEQQLQDNGRILLRPSGTEPIIRLMVEGDDSVINTVANQLAEIIKQRNQQL